MSNMLVLFAQACVLQYITYVLRSTSTTGLLDKGQHNCRAAMYGMLALSQQHANATFVSMCCHANSSQPSDSKQKNRMDHITKVVLDTCLL